MSEKRRAAQPNRAAGPIDYVAYTGDIMENRHAGYEHDDEKPYRKIAIEKIESAFDAQKILDDAETVNSVLPANNSVLPANPRQPFR